MKTAGSDQRDHRPGRRAGSAPGLTLAVGLVGASCFLWWQAHRLYFFGDDWEFLLDRHLTWSDLMRPHNEHWSTLPVLAFLVMRRALGIAHYPAYAAMPIILHAACCVLIYTLIRRHGTPPWPTVAIVLPFAFLAGNLGENPMWDFQIGFLGSVVLGLVAVLAHTGPPDVDTRPALLLGVGWAGSVLSLMSSGMGIMMLGWLAVLILLTRGWLRMLMCAIPPGIVYATWYVAYGRNASGAAPRATADAVVSFVAEGLGALWQNVVRVDGSGAVVLLGLTAVALVGPLRVGQRHLALAGVVTVVGFYLLLGLSRAGFGVDFASSSRYAYIGLLFTLPAAAASLDVLSDRLPDGRLQRTLTLGVIATLLIGNGVAQTLAFVDGRTQIASPALETRIAATEVLIDRGGRFLAAVVAPPYDTDLTVSALRRPGVRAELPHTDVNRKDELDASVSLQVASGPASAGLRQPERISTHGVSSAPAPSTCTALTAQDGAWIDLPPSEAGSEVSITSTAANFPSQLIRGALVSEPVTLAAVSGAPTFIATTSRVGTLRVNLEPGPVTVCLGVRP